MGSPEQIDSRVDKLTSASQIDSWHSHTFVAYGKSLLLCWRDAGNWTQPVKLSGRSKLILMSR